MAASRLAVSQAHFEGLTPNPSWAFQELTQKQTNYATHGYHRYPAKFIPQLAARLIEEYSSPNDWVVDPFMGSGTTLVEAKLLGRPSVGTDINPVAHLIARAKTQAIEPEYLAQTIEQVLSSLYNTAQPSLFEELLEKTAISPPEWHERLRYWFPESALQQLAQIQHAINRIPDDSVRTFLACALSHILKTVSFWHDRSVEPIRKLNKTIPDARVAFQKHLKRMARGNREFWELLTLHSRLDVPTLPHCADARTLPLVDESATLVVTSPPYVTSYEYADLHQLSALWFGWTSNLQEFRQRFIGRTNNNHARTLELGSTLAERIVAQLAEICPRKAREVALYFSEMATCFGEMRRILKPGGYVCIVIGNTNLCGVEVQNAQVFTEQLDALGFSIERVILREIPSKILPRTRDKTTGKFAKTEEANYIAYPTEYILVARRACS